MKGRPPKTTEKHKADGTYQPVRHAHRLTAPLVEGIPDPPADFDAEHRKRWAEVATILRDQNILTFPDTESLKLYVELDIIRGKAHRAYSKSGDKADWLIYRDAVQQMMRLQTDFGFTPRSRMAMKVEKPKPQTSILELMKGPVKKAI
jgi:phage terminase small subunit